jgi:O-antigen/teichoic acid export membrane protein
MTLRFEYLVMLRAEQRESHNVLRLAFRLGAVHTLWLTPLLWFLPAQWAWLQAQGAISDWLWLAPVTAWAASMAVGAQQTVQRSGDFKSTAAAEFVGRSAYVASAILGALALPNLLGLVGSTFANAGFKLIWLFRNIGKHAHTWFKSKASPISKSIRRMAVSTSASNLISLFTGMAPMVFIADHYGAEALGQYGLVVSTLYLPSSLLGQAIGQVYYQRASRLQAEGNSFRGVLVSTSRNLAKIGLPLFGVVALISPIAYPLVFGNKWDVAGELAQSLCLAAAAGFLSTPLDRTSLIVGAWWYLSAWHGLRAILTFACLIASATLDLRLETLVLWLSLQNGGTYMLDWFLSYIFSCRRSMPIGANSHSSV